MFLGKFSISDHAHDQYLDRANNIVGGNVNKSIRYDLRTMNIKKIVHKPNGKIHVFTRGFKEFIFKKKKNDTLLLVTFISRNMKDTEVVYNKRLREKEQMSAARA